MQNNKKNKTSLRSFNMKQVMSQIDYENSSVISIADNSIANNNTSNLTLSFPSCPAGNLQCGGPAYIRMNSATMQIYVYVNKQFLDDSVNKNNITQFEFSFSNSTFGITYNEKESKTTYYEIDNVTGGYEAFDVTENANILFFTLELVLNEIIIPQITYKEKYDDNLYFFISSPNVILNKI
jgi:hypothetical protein